MAWTEQQIRAIETRDCGLIVSAAAGSGKTSVLVERLLRILMEEAPERRTPADRMIVVTFTNDAASEMRSRLFQVLEKELQKQPENQWLYQQQILLQSAHICTISSFCFDLIRDNLTDYGITSGFRILNDTESRMIAAKAADQVLNRWHEEHPQDMKLLWDSFCEKNDMPLEQILMELHQFLGSVPFRDSWCCAVLDGLRQPLADSPYHQALMQQLQQIARTAVNQAQEAASLAADLYDSVDENTVLPWVEEDLHCLEQVLRLIQTSEVDADRILSPILEKKVNRGRKTFPRKKKSIRSEEIYERVKQLRGQYSALENNMIDLLETVFPYEIDDLEQHLQLTPLLFEMEQDLSETIWQTKVQQNALSFEDGERLALELLSVQTKDGRIHPSPLAKELQEYYQLIMIDEYQDSNNKQDDIFKLLSRNCIDPETGALRYGDNVFLVGDVKQSIYRFRLANPQNFVHAMEDAAAGNGVCRHIALNRNFRSAPAILQFVNFLCGNLMSPSCGDVAYNEGEALYAGASIGELLPREEQAVHIAVLKKTEEQDEEDMDLQTEYVIRQIRNMIQQGSIVVEKDGSTRPCTYRDFCVLLRNNTQCMTLAHALEEAGIPVQSPEEKGYLQAREISILLDMLRVLDNPLLDTALAAIMLSPMFWFTAQELTQVRMLSRHSSLYAALCRAAGVLPDAETEKETLDEILVQKSRYLYDTLQKLRQDAALMTLEALIRRIYDTTDFLSVMQLTKDGEKKRANLYLLIQYAKQYEENAETAHCGLSGFLRYIDWLLESGNDFQQTSLSAGTENAVAVKTMHRSKGLEYPFVFLGKLETMFSKEDTRKSAIFSDHNMLGFCIKDPATYTRAKTMPFSVLEQENQNLSKSEELRLLYVAMTRAKQQLFLPLDAEKIRTKNRDYLSEYGALILSDGTLPSLLVQSASSMAHWVWMCLVLIHDTVLDKEVSLPAQTWQTPAWSDGLQIQYEFQLPEEIDFCAEEEMIHAAPLMATVADIRRMVKYQYQSEDSTRESLLSVSAIQEARKHRAPVWKRPRFLQEERRLTGAERGTAVHTFFQYADFRQAEQDVLAEIQRLQTYGFLTEAQADVIQPELVTAFFRDGIYERLRRSHRVLREQKFLVQCRDISAFPEAAKILHRYQDSDSILKGIIDLAFQEGDAFVLVDYKTDYVTKAEELVDSYRDQLMLYCGALQCITGLPVQQCYLYSTHLKTSIEVK